MKAPSSIALSTERKVLRSWVFCLATNSITSGVNRTRPVAFHEPLVNVGKTAQKSKASPTVGVAGMPSLVKSTNCLVVELKPRPANLRLS